MFLMGKYLELAECFRVLVVLGGGVYCFFWDWGKLGNFL